MGFLKRESANTSKIISVKFCSLVKSHTFLTNINISLLNKFIFYAVQRFICKTKRLYFIQENKPINAAAILWYIIYICIYVFIVPKIYFLRCQISPSVESALNPTYFIRMKSLYDCVFIKSLFPYLDLIFPYVFMST